MTSPETSQYPRLATGITRGTLRVLIRVAHMEIPRHVRPIVPLCILTVAVGCGSTGSTDRLIVVHDVTIVDGRAPTPVPGMSVVIEGTHISAVGPAASLPVPDNAQVVDGTGRYLIPGLWDMHTHALWQPFVDDGFLTLFVVNGVTGIRDMGGTLHALSTVRANEGREDFVVPRIVAAGPWLNSFSIDPRTEMIVETPQEARDAVATLDEAGVDFVKTYVQLSCDLFLAVLVDVGMTECKVIRAATLGAAEYLEVVDSMGTVEAGKVADLLLLDANPLDDIRNTRRIRAVISNGRLLDRRALDAQFARIELGISAEKN